MKLKTVLSTGIIVLAPTAAHSSTLSIDSMDSISTIESKSSPASRILNKIKVSFKGTYFGNTLANPSDSTVKNEWGLKGKKYQRFESTLLTAYRITDNGVTAGLGLNSTYYSVRGKGFELTAPYLKLGHSKLIHFENFNYSADLRAFLPTTEVYRERGRITRLRSIQNASYEVPSSRFTLGYELCATYSVLSEKALKSEEKLALALIPGVGYRFSPKLTLNLDYEMETANTKADPLLDSTAQGARLYFGPTLSPSEKLSLKPYVTLNPGTKFLSAETTFLNLDLNARLL